MKIELLFRFLPISSFVVMLSMVTLPSLASNEKSDNIVSRVTVEWHEPKRFTDIRSASISSEKHRRQIFTALEKHLNKLARDLPEGQQLALIVTDLDLAGRVEPGRFSGFINTHNDVRIVRRIDIPRMTFSYKLTDASGNVIQQENVKLKDINFMSNVGRQFNRGVYFYEKLMISDWFKDTLLNHSA